MIHAQLKSFATLKVSIILTPCYSPDRQQIHVFSLITDGYGIIQVGLRLAQG
jgi:hypothetical protein